MQSLVVRGIFQCSLVRMDTAAVRRSYRRIPLVPSSTHLVISTDPVTETRFFVAKGMCGSFEAQQYPLKPDNRCCSPCPSTKQTSSLWRYSLPWEPQIPPCFRLIFHDRLVGFLRSSSSNQLTLWLRIVLEKRAVAQLVKKLPTFHVIWKFVIISTRTHRMSLSWTWISRHPQIKSFNMHVNVILQFTSRSRKFPFFSSGLPTKILYAFLISTVCAKFPLTATVFIWSPQSYLAKRTNYKSPHYSVSRSLVLPHCLRS